LLSLGATSARCALNSNDTSIATLLLSPPLLLAWDDKLFSQCCCPVVVIIVVTLLTMKLFLPLPWVFDRGGRSQSAKRKKERGTMMMRRMRIAKDLSFSLPRCHFLQQKPT